MWHGVLKTTALNFLERTLKYNEILNIVSSCSGYFCGAAWGCHGKGLSWMFQTKLFLTVFQSIQSTSKPPKWASLNFLRDMNWLVLYTGCMFQEGSQNLSPLKCSIVPTSATLISYTLSTQAAHRNPYLTNSRLWMVDHSTAAVSMEY